MLYHLPTLLRLVGESFTRRHLSLRFLLWIAPILVIQTLLTIAVGVARALDHLIFPGFRSSRVEAPVFIVGTPRSGTTFLHRLLAADDRFTYLRLYQTLFPSVMWYRFFQVLARVDGRVGSPLRRFALRPLNRLFFRGWDGIHATGFERAEEDEMIWLHLWLTPGAVVYFPWIGVAEQAIHVDRHFDPRRRARLSRYLHAAVRRHLYAAGGGRTYLGKNALSAGRIERYLEAFPDMRVIHVARHPYESIPSALSMFTRPWRLCAPGLAGPGPEATDLAELLCEYYRLLEGLRDRLPPERYASVSYTDLVSDPVETVRSIYDRLGIELSESFAQRLAEDASRAAGYVSTHDYDLASFGIDEEWIRRRLPDVFTRHGFS